MSLTLVQSRWQGWVVRSQRCRRHHRKIQTIARLSPPVVIASALFVEARGCRRGSEDDPELSKRKLRSRKEKKDKKNEEGREGENDEDVNEDEEAARRGIRYRFRRDRRGRSRGSCQGSSRFLEDRQGRRWRRFVPGLTAFRARFNRVESRPKRLASFASRERESRALIPFVLLLPDEDHDRYEDDPFDLSDELLLSVIAR